jgi:hypothetical protein
VGDCNCVMAKLVPAIHDFASLQQRRLDARDKLGHEEAGTGACDFDQGACTLCVSLANIVLARGRGRCAAEFVQRTRPVANTSNLDKGVKRRRILPPRHGQELHLAPDGVALNWN